MGVIPINLGLKPKEDRQPVGMAYSHKREERPTRCHCDRDVLFKTPESTWAKTLVPSTDMHRTLRYDLTFNLAFNCRCPSCPATVRKLDMNPRLAGLSYSDPGKPRSRALQVPLAASAVRGPVLSQAETGASQRERRRVLDQDDQTADTPDFRSANSISSNAHFSRTSCRHHVSSAAIQCRAVKFSTTVQKAILRCLQQVMSESNTILLSIKLLQG